MQEERTQLLKAKQQALHAAKEKALRQKEQLTQEIVQCGLWQTHDDIMKGLAMEKSKSAKIKALKAQLKKSTGTAASRQGSICLFQERETTFSG